MSWDSNEGELVLLNNDETFMSHILSCLNTFSRKTTSYKYGFLKAILDNLYNSNNYTISFDFLSITFSKLYWNIVVKYQLPQRVPSKQGNLSDVEKIIFDLMRVYPKIQDVDFDSLDKIIQKNYVASIKNVMQKYVVGALYSEFSGRIYGFTKDGEYIYFNKESFNFLSDNKTVIEKLNYYSWIIWTEKILEKKKSGINNVAFKLDSSTETKRNNLFEYKKKIFEKLTDCRCFYCDSVISSTNCEIDHFIPWKFVKNDQIWNLVPSCKKCNSNKKEKIPSRYYLDKIIIRNYNLLDGESFKSNLEKLYDAAIFNGYILWEK